MKEWCAGTRTHHAMEMSSPNTLPGSPNVDVPIFSSWSEFVLKMTNMMQEVGVRENEARSSNRVSLSLSSSMTVVSKQFPQEFPGVTAMP